MRLAGVIHQGDPLIAPRLMVQEAGGHLLPGPGRRLLRNRRSSCRRTLLPGDWGRRPFPLLLRRRGCSRRRRGGGRLALWRSRRRSSNSLWRRWPLEDGAAARGAVLLSLEPRPEAVQVEDVAAEQLLVAARRRHLLAADDADAVGALEVLRRRVGEAVEAGGDLRPRSEKGSDVWQHST